MAWPLTPLTTYVDDTTPAISASDLNDIQDAINQAFLGTYSYKGITIDGTGGVSTATTAGTLSTSGTATLNALSVTTTSAVTGAATFGSTVVATAGVQGLTLKATASKGGTSLPTSSVAAGVIYAESGAAAWGKVASGGGLTLGVNISTITHSGTGVYDITLTTAYGTGISVIASPESASALAMYAAVKVTSTSAFTVYLFNASNTASDLPFCFAVFGF